MENVVSFTCCLGIERDRLKVYLQNIGQTQGRKDLPWPVDYSSGTVVDGRVPSHAEKLRYGLPR